MQKLATAILVVSSLLSLATCHQCNDGSRVKCTAIQTTNGAPSTNGQSFDAQGYPACTPKGERLFCLVDHDYHRCSVGMQPCCLDGSGPSHNGAHAVDGHKIECKSTEEMEAEKAVDKLTQLNTPDTPSIDPIVLDDMTAKPNNAVLENAHEGSYQPCMADAYNGQFHHDWAQKSTSSSFAFKFMPPASGCYSLEEYHPGSQQACARYMPSNSHLDVDHHGGMSTLYINQAQNPAKWNEIGMFMFSKGDEGRLIMKNSAQEKCGMGSGGDCFWVVDAFRLTWKAHQCPGDVETVQEKPVAMTKDEPASPQKSGCGKGAHPRMVAPPADAKEGLLVLSAILADGVSSDSVVLKIQKHKNDFQATLAAHLGYKTINIAMVARHGRRLHEDHHHGAVTFHIPFTAQEKIVGATDNDLKQAMQANLDAIVPGVTVEMVDMQWLIAPPAKNVEKEDDIALHVGAICAVLALLGFASFLVWKNMQHWKAQKASKTNEEKTIKPQVVDVKADMGKEEIDDLENASTASPASDPTPSEDGIVSEGNSVTPARDEEAGTFAVVI